MYICQTKKTVFTLMSDLCLFLCLSALCLYACHLWHIANLLTTSLQISASRSTADLQCVLGEWGGGGMGSLADIYDTPTLLHDTPTWFGRHEQ